MSPFSRSAVLAALALAACGGGSSSPAPDISSPAPDIKSFFPASNEVAGWTQDAAKPLQVGVGASGATGLVDGAANPFVTEGLAQLALESYVDGIERLDLRVWQMKDAAAATSVYTALLSNSLYAANSWGSCTTTIGEACRIAQTSGGNWWINVRKTVYYVEATVSPQTAATNAQAEAFARAVAAKIP